jgi:hypothetical protein
LSNAWFAGNMLKIIKKFIPQNPERALLTDTSPVETLLIYSNHGFQKYAAQRIPIYLQPVIKSFFDKRLSHTIPYSYNIDSGKGKVRNIAIPHPIAQNRMVEFIDKSTNFILYYCGKSAFSLRFPFKIGTIYKQIVELDEKDTKDAAVEKIISYYSYRPYYKLHEFYNSADFQILEQSFHRLRIIDIHKCFYNIYSHTIAWAIAGKEEAKKQRRYKTLFSSRFDALMQFSNYGETNGIVVGPELSRVFAEIILQSIDKKVEEELIEKISPDSFSIKRFVDDIHIFSNETLILDLIESLYVKHLSIFNLYINHQKSATYNTPYSLPLVVSTNKIQIILQQIESYIFQDNTINNNPDIKKIRDDKKLSSYICNIIRSEYNTDVIHFPSTYFISSLSRITEIILKLNLQSKEINSHILFLINISSYAFHLEPNTYSFYKLALLYSHIIIYINKIDQNDKFGIKQHLYEHLFEIIFSKHKNDSFESLEGLNSILILSQLDIAYAMPEEKLFNLLPDNPNYMQIVTLLYYAKDNSKYSALRSALQEIIIQKLASFYSSIEDTELTLLFWDSLSCPYIDFNVKCDLYKKYIDQQYNKGLGKSKIEKHIKYFQENPWFVDWRNTSFIELIKRKDLTKVY